MDLIVIRLAIEFNIFRYLEEDEKGLSFQEMVKITRVAPNLLGRILRYLKCINAIDDHNGNALKLTKMGKAFAAQKGISGVRLL